MFGKKKQIKVNVKLLAGLDRIDGYNPETGIEISFPEGTKLKKAVKKLNLPKQEPIAFIINGEKVDPTAKLKEGDEIFCFLPVSGG